MLRTKQFKGDDTEYPYDHVEFFIDIRGTLRVNAFTDEEMKLKLFPYTLCDASLSWLKTYPTGHFDSWEKLSTIFYSHFYPERQSYGARHMITNFKNRPRESLMHQGISQVSWST